MATLRELLEDLDPPAGGLVKLRLRIADERVRRQKLAFRFALIPAVATAAVLLVMVSIPRPVPLVVGAADNPALAKEWPVLELRVDGQAYKPIVDDGVVWIVP